MHHKISVKESWERKNYHKENQNQKELDISNGMEIITNVFIVWSSAVFLIYCSKVKNKLSNTAFCSRYKALCSRDYTFGPSKSAISIILNRDEERPSEETLKIRKGHTDIC